MIFSIQKQNKVRAPLPANNWSSSAATHLPSRRGFQSKESGVTMIELMVIVGLIAFIYSVAVPQFNMRSGTETATRTQRLADDIRSAFDMAVLTNRPHRIVFEMGSGRYHLESTSSQALIDSDPLGHDLTDEEEKTKIEEFENETKDLTSLAGDPIKDEDGKEIPGSNLSPILRNRKKAEPLKWEVVENLEWTNRSLGNFLLISEMQAEHHAEKQVLADLGPKARGFLYFYPQGYVERAYIRVAIKKDDMVPDETQLPYTIVTKPFLGTASVQAGIIEYDVHDAKKDEENE
jgi:type II secretory pathway pseudopilin PulG